MPTYREKRSIWLTVLEVSVHDWLLWTYSSTPPEGMAEQSRSPRGQEAKGGRGRGSGTKEISFEGIPPITGSPSTGPHLLQVPLPPNSAKLGTMPLRYGPLGTL
jgi:hypothetical protein